MFEKYAQLIDDNGIDTKILADVINEHATLQRQTKDRYGRYRQTKSDVPIFGRFDDEKERIQNKVNNELANDYFSEIIDTKVGYMFGTPVSVMYDKESPGYNTIIEKINQFKKMNNLDDLNAEWCKFSGMAGYDAGLLYVDKEGQERVMRLNPWESIIISKTEITEPEYGVNYYETWNDNVRVEFYSPQGVRVFEGKSFGAQELAEIEEEAKENPFEVCQMFGIPNNAELMGDADKVLSLIDAYDRSISDMNSEIEQFRLAYLIFIGFEPDQDTLDEMIKTGALHIPTAQDGEKIDWLTKNLDPKYVDSHLDRLEANIQRLSKHVNFTDAAFGSDITGPAMRYKLFHLETKSKTYERKHNAALMHMFKGLGNAWEKRGIPFDWTKLDAQYTRNIPVNVVDEATAATTLMALTSRRTALGTLSMVDDPDEEMERIQQEQEEFGFNLDTVEEDEDTPPGDE